MTFMHHHKDNSLYRPKRNHSLLRSWVVVLAAALFFFYEFIQMTMFNAIDPNLMRTFHVSAAKLGNLSAMYFYANVCFIFPAGLLLDRFSTRKLLAIAMGLSVISNYGFALSPYFSMLAICRFITGLGSAFCMLSCVRLASQWFVPKRVAFVVGIVVTVAMLGGVMGQTPMTIMTQHFGWRYAVIINATLGLVLLVIMGLFVRDYPDYQSSIYHQTQQKLRDIGFYHSIRLALCNSQNWLAGAYANLLSLPVIILGAMWGIMYLSQARHLSYQQASYVTSMLFFGTILGSPAMGWISDHIGLRKSPMIVGAVFSLLISLIIISQPHLGVVSLMILFFLLAFTASSQVIAYTLVVESNPFAITSASEGVACTLVMTAGVIFQPLYGWIMDSNWQGTMLNGIRLFSPHAYFMAMLILPTAFTAALVASLFLKETYCKLEQD